MLVKQERSLRMTTPGRSPNGAGHTVGGLGLGLLVLVSLGVTQTALADDTGTPEPVTVKVRRGGEGVSGMKLRVVGEPPGGGEITYAEGSSDDKGIFSFKVPWKLGLQLWAEGSYEGVRYSSPKAALAGDPGAGLILNLEVFTKGDGATLKDLSVGAESHLILQIEEGFLDITESLTIQNNAKSTFAPKDGLQIPLPAGFRKVRGQGDKPAFALEHIGASVPGPFLPGNTELQIRFELPIKSSTLDFNQKLSIPWPGARLIINELKGLNFEGPSVLQQEQRESQGRPLRLVSLQAKDQQLEFTITGLPVRDNQSKWIALGVAIVVALIGFVFGVLPVKETTSRAKLHLQELKEEEAALLEDLEEMAREQAQAGVEAQGTQGTKDLNEDRELAMNDLAAVLRAIDDLEQQA